MKKRVRWSGGRFAQRHVTQVASSQDGNPVGAVTRLTRLDREWEQRPQPGSVGDRSNRSPLPKCLPEFHRTFTKVEHPRKQEALIRLSTQLTHHRDHDHIIASTAPITIDDS
jgi:hypothetical protein